MAKLMKGYSDRRVTQAALCPLVECWQPEDGTPEPAADEPYWFDWVADIGDGFDATFAVAWALAEPKLDLGPDATDLRRGDLLVLGGDQVYPTPSEKEYLDRTLRPYALAEHAERDRDLRVLAIPGNHDWFDGLEAFTEMFETGHHLGARTAEQRHSYFARRLPRGWWILGADTALDGQLDFAQMEFFADVVAPQIGPDDNVILCFHAPVWVFAAKKGDQEIQAVLRFFRERVCTAGQLRLCLAGDLHHYSRYVDEAAEPDDQVQYVTAGGGGAYLLSTHDLWKYWPRLDLTGAFRRTRHRFPLLSGERSTAVDQAPEGADRAKLECTYPDERTSRRLSVQVLWRMFSNWPMGLCLAVTYFLATLVEGHSLRAAAAYQSGFGEVLARIVPLCPLTDPACRASIRGQDVAYGAAEFGLTLARSPGPWIILAILVAACWSLPIPKRLRYAGPALRLGHAVAHAGAFFLVQGIYLFVTRQLDSATGGPLWTFGFLVWNSIGGYVAGLAVCAVYLLVASWFGAHHNELYCAMRLATHKNFLRLRIDPDGGLTVYPVKVESPPRVRWTGSHRLDLAALKSYRTQTELIEPPIRIAPRQR